MGSHDLTYVRPCDLLTHAHSVLVKILQLPRQSPVSSGCFPRFTHLCRYKIDYYVCSMLKTKCTIHKRVWQEWCAADSDAEHMANEVRARHGVIVYSWAQVSTCSTLFFKLVFRNQDGKQLTIFEAQVPYKCDEDRWDSDKDMQDGRDMWEFSISRCPQHLESISQALGPGQRAS